VVSAMPASLGSKAACPSTRARSTVLVARRLAQHENPSARRKSSTLANASGASVATMLRRSTAGRKYQREFVACRLIRYER
jgi:hypothetical protein